jgi:outer membrane lipoprotein-sorting protein
MPRSLAPRRRFLATCAAAAASATLSRLSRADEVSDALAEVTRARADLKTLVAPFTQERTIGLLATVVKSEGELTLVRPDRLRWELRPPDAITYWVTPEGLAFATASGGASMARAGAGRFGAVLGDLLVFLGGDLEALRARYDITVPSRGAGGITLVARPKADDVKKHVKALTLALTADRWSAERVVIEENGGDKSVITFGKATRDVKVPPVKMVPPTKSG